MREDHVKSAIAFLQEPEVASAPLNKKIEFLESKGLTQEEINAALQSTETPTGAQTSPPAGTQNGVPAAAQRSAPAPQFPPVPAYMLQQPPPIPKRDWKDYFVMATVSVGVAYGLYECAKRYVLPAILPPTPAALEQDKEALEQEFQRTEQLLEQLQKDTAELKEQEEQRNESFKRFMTEAYEVVHSIKEQAEDRKQESKLALANVETLRDSIPRTLEKHSETSAAAISELQAELKSLKSLVSRSKTSPTLPIPPASAVPTSLPRMNRTESPKPGSESNSSSVEPEPFIPDPQKKASIPEWQRAIS